jgi:hypothetical protein
MHTIKNIAQKLRKVHIAWWLLLTCVLACFGLYALLKEVNRQMEHETLAPIAERVGIEPTWQALDIYMTETFTPGMPRDEVLKELEKMGFHELSSTYPVNDSEGVWFDEVVFRRQYPPIVFTFLFTPDGTLLRFSGHGD